MTQTFKTLSLFVLIQVEMENMFHCLVRWNIIKYLCWTNAFLNHHLIYSLKCPPEYLFEIAQRSSGRMLQILKCDKYYSKYPRQQESREQNGENGVIPRNPRISRSSPSHCTTEINTEIRDRLSSRSQCCFKHCVTKFNIIGLQVMMKLGPISNPATITNSLVL